MKLESIFEVLILSFIAISPIIIFYYTDQKFAFIHIGFLLGFTIPIILICSSKKCNIEAFNVLKIGLITGIVFSCISWFLYDKIPHIFKFLIKN